MNIRNFQIGDIVGTTSLAPWTMAIKGKTWGWRYIFSQTKSSHIATVCGEHRLFYFMEMLGKGIHQTDIHDYDNRAPKSHVCFVGRHKAFDDPVIREKYNEFMLDLHERRVKYGWDDIENHILVKLGIQIHDKEDTLICNELPKVGFAWCKIPYPKEWDSPTFAPMHWQVYKNPLFTDVTKQII